VIRDLKFEIADTGQQQLNCRCMSVAILRVLGANSIQLLRSKEREEKLKYARAALLLQVLRFP